MVLRMYAMGVGMKKFLSMMLSFCVCFGLAMDCIGAQSTADVSASADLKKSGRKEVLNARKTDEAGIDEYIIGQGDLLNVSIYGEGDMSAFEGAMDTNQTPPAVKVRVDGRISLKHVGDVHAEGLTLTELADYLKILYSTIYDEPIITTVLIAGNSKRYTMMGKVLTPGIFPLDSHVTLVQAVASSGGFNEWANSEITVVRKIVKTKNKGLFKGNILKFDYDDFLEGKNLQKNIAIQAGDIIIVH